MGFHVLDFVGGLESTVGTWISRGVVTALEAVIHVLQK